MRDVAAQQPRDGWGRAEEDTLAAIVSASETRRAGVAWYTGFDRDAIARLKMRYGWMDGDYLVQNSRS